MNSTQIESILETKILPLVKKPGQYIGGEVNSVVKDLDSVNVRLALAFPDLYEVGMSNLGIKILYEVVNNQKDLYAERVFCPWIDMEHYMRLHNVPLFSLETYSPLSEFDIIGFSLQYELCYTNLITMLDLSGIPLFTKERMEGHWPLIIAGGTMTYTPEPIASFIDVFVVGDGEDSILDIMNLYKKSKEKSKKELLCLIAKEIPGVYVPSLYNVKPDEKNRLTNIIPSSSGVPFPVKKRVFDEFENLSFPKKPVVPIVSIIHDRTTVEIMRGCPRQCKFCQAGVLDKPLRKRSHDSVITYVNECVRNTGDREIGLYSLSSTDYKGIEVLAKEIMDSFPQRQVSISLPSMRVDNFSLEVIDQISQTKKTGITLAPEAATDKMLKIINKGIKTDDVRNVVSQAYKKGYRLVKLYFMIGLPEEEKEDLDAIVDLVYELRDMRKKISGGLGQINVSIATLIPKPFTAFERLDMTKIEEINRKQLYLSKKLRNKNIKLKFHSAQLSILESLFCRGDRRLGEVLLKAWQLGARFDQWTESFKYDLWEKAFRECKIDMETYLFGWEERDRLPWEHIFIPFQYK